MYKTYFNITTFICQHNFINFKKWFIPDMENAGFKSVNNVINKINIYLKKQRITLHQFTNDVGCTYQTIHRLLNHSFLPSIQSLQIIAEYFNCSISELMDDSIFIDIPVYNNLSHFFGNCPIEEQIRVYMQYNEYLPLYDKEFFAINNSKNQLMSIKSNSFPVILNTHCCQVFYKTDKISIDGQHIVDYDYQKQIINVVSVSRKTVFIELNNQPKDVPIENIIPIAVYLNTAFYPNNMSYFRCISINNQLPKEYKHD